MSDLIDTTQTTQAAPVDWAAIAAEVSSAAGAPVELQDAPPAPSQASEPAPEVQAAPEPPTPPPVESASKQILREARLEKELREKAARLDEERAALAKEREEFRAGRDKIKGDINAFLDDPVGWLESSAIPKDRWVEVAEDIYLSLAPGEAPPEHRLKQEHRKYKREREAWEKERQSERERLAQEAQRAQDAALESAYRSSLAQHIAAPDVTYAASKAWFGDDQAAYVETMLSTARNLAEAAQARGEHADLSPKTVAEQVETYLASRFSRWTPQTSPTPAPQTTQAHPPTSSPTPTKNPVSSVPPARAQDSWEEREARAMAVLAERLGRGK